jgi:hypothetical protein
MEGCDNVEGVAFWNKYRVHKGLQSGVFGVCFAFMFCVRFVQFE